MAAGVAVGGSYGLFYYSSRSLPLVEAVPNRGLRSAQVESQGSRIAALHTVSTAG